MSRMTRWAARLYPRWWRERYGEEFAALLDDTNPDTRGTFDILKGALAMQMTTLSAKRVFCLTTITGLLLGVITAFILTPQFSSTATLGIPGSRDDREASMRVNTDIQRILSRGSLVQLIRDLGLYPDLRSKMAARDLLDKMREDIRVMPLTGTSESTFQIEFRYPDRVVAHRTVSALTLEFEKAGFTIKSPASLAQTPIFPNRLNISLSGIFIGMVLGSLSALMMHVFRRHVKHAA